MSGQPLLKVALVALNWPGYQSLALGYLRAFAEADQHLAGRAAFVTLDLDSEMDPWWVAYRILGLEPDVVAFSVMCWNANKVFTTCSLIKQAMPDIRIVIGGPEVTPIAEQVLEKHPEIEIAVRGEGEETFAELIHTMLGTRKLSYVDGVTVRDGDRITSAPDRPLIANLDDIPSPYTAGVLQPLQGSAYIETFRGCPHDCGYCFEGKGYGRVRYFSKERVTAEIDALAGSGAVTSFSFVDPVFNLTRDRLEWLSEVLAPHAARGLRLHTIEVDIEHIDDEEAEMLSRAGVVSVETGPQTVGAAALEACHRRFDRDRFVSGVEALKRRGISVECDLIIGLPGDTLQDFFDGLDFLVELDPGIIQMSSLHVLPGTDLWNRAEELGLVFNQDPPHEIIHTATMGFAELRRAEAYGSTVSDHYRARLHPKQPQAGGLPQEVS
jgi:anaerobic magnesium-protoporphyrin IX monomethyl ester cyclase